MSRIALAPWVALLGLLVTALWGTPAHAADPEARAAFDEAVDQLPEIVPADRTAWLPCRGRADECLAPYAVPRKKDWSFHIAPYG